MEGTGFRPLRVCCRLAAEKALMEEGRERRSLGDPSPAWLVLGKFLKEGREGQSPGNFCLDGYGKCTHKLEGIPMWAMGPSRTYLPCCGKPALMWGWGMEGRTLTDYCQLAAVSSLLDQRGTPVWRGGPYRVIAARRGNLQH